MGQALGCGQRTKENSSFSDEDYSCLVRQFNKYSKIKDGSAGTYIGYQGFQQLFPTNKQFSRRLYRWITNRNQQKNQLDFKQYLFCAECFLSQQNPEWSSKNHDIKQYSKLELFGIVSLENQIQGKEFDREYVNRVEISYSEGLEVVKQLIQMFYNDEDMQNPSVENDDIASKIVLNGIFKNLEVLEFYQFFSKLSDQLMNVESYIENYIHEIFMGVAIKESIIPEQYFEESQEEIPSLILRKSITAVLCLSNPLFGEYQYMKPLFEYLSYEEEEFDFACFSESLLQFNEGPTLILMRHIEQFDEVDEYAQAKGVNLERVGKNHYVLGIMNNQNYKEYPQLSGDSQTTIFSIIPDFRVFSPLKGEQGKQYANLSLKQQFNGVKTGLSIGGDPKNNQSRIFIGENIQESYIDNQGIYDKTYPQGKLLDSNIKNLNIDILEVWGLSNTVIINNNQQVVHKSTVKIDPMLEDIGVMKSQDQDCISELEKVHNRVTTAQNFNNIEDFNNSHQGRYTTNSYIKEVHHTYQQRSSN